MPRPSAYSGHCRLIISDVDRTFLSSHQEVLPENIRAVKAAQAAGIPFAFGTGRYWPSLQELMADIMPLHGCQVVDDGATVVDADGWRVLSATPLPLEAIRLTWELSCRHGFVPILGLPDTYYGFHVDEGTREDMVRHREYVTECASEAEYFSHAGQCVKVVFFAVAQEAAARAALADELVRCFQARGLPVHVAFVEPEIIVVSNEGITKMTGIRQVCRLMGFTPADVMAIGDADNDAEMLAGCGLGIAVGNGTEAARAAATHVVATCDEGGVAQAIQMLLEGKFSV